MDGGTACLGISFGELPVDDLRFMTALAAMPWSGVHAGTRWPNRAMQSKKLGTMDQVSQGAKYPDPIHRELWTA